MAKKEKILNPVNFQGNDFEGFSYINTAGDTIRQFTTTEARPGEYYQIEYVMPKDNSPMKIRTEKDTAGLLAGKKYAVDPNGNIGDWLNESFLIPAKQLPINHDRSKATGIKKLGYKVLEYLNKFQQGGNVPTNNSLNVMAKQQFNKVDPNLSNMTPNFQEGGEVGSNLGQLAKAAFQMANELKKQGAITEVAGEQVIAQAFQQTPEAAKMFVEAAQKQDVQTIVQLFTKLGIVK